MIIHEVLFHWWDVVNLVILLVNWMVLEDWFGVAIGRWLASVAEVLHHAAFLLVCAFVQLLIEVELPFTLGPCPILLSLWPLLPLKLASAQ